MVNVEEGKVVRYEFYDSIHQTEHLSQQVHTIHERPRNAARVRLRVRFVVPFRKPWEDSNRGQTTRSRAYEHLYDLGIRKRDIEKIEFYPDSHFFGETIIATATIKDAADRIQSHSRDASK